MASPWRANSIRRSSSFNGLGAVTAFIRIHSGSRLSLCQLIVPSAMPSSSRCSALGSNERRTASPSFLRLPNVYFSAVSPKGSTRSSSSSSSSVWSSYPASSFSTFLRRFSVTSSPSSIRRTRRRWFVPSCDRETAISMVSSWRPLPLGFWITVSVVTV